MSTAQDVPLTTVVETDDEDMSRGSNRRVEHFESWPMTITVMAPVCTQISVLLNREFWTPRQGPLDRQCPSMRVWGRATFLHHLLMRAAANGATVPRAGIWSFISRDLVLEAGVHGHAMVTRGALGGEEMPGSCCHFSSRLGGEGSTLWDYPPFALDFAAFSRGNILCNGLLTGHILFVYFGD